MMAKVTSAIWGFKDETIITGHENGVIATWNSKTGDFLTSVKEHTASVVDLQPSTDYSTFISASKDTSAKLFGMSDLKVHKQYLSGRPVNSAAISPLKEHIVLGGGQEGKEPSCSVML